MRRTLLTDGKERIKRSRGLTLLEIIFILVIAGIAIPTLLASFADVVGVGADARSVITGTNLAQQKMEEIIRGKGFSQIVSVGSTNLTGDFSNYNYEIAVDYVDAADLNTPIGEEEPPTNYKLVQAIITKDGMENWNVTLKTIVTNLGY